MNGTLLNIGIPILGIGLVYFISKRKNISFKNDIGLIFPKWKDLLFWAILFFVLIVIEEFALKQFGEQTTNSWIDKYSIGEMILRSIGIVILAPISEELIFRGLLYAKIKKTSLKYVGAIVIPAIIFSLIHIQYAENLTFVIIFIDGLFLGLARHFSKSVILTIILHSLANIVAIVEKFI